MKKTCKKIALMAGILTLVTAIMSPMVTADGWHPSEEYLHLYEPYQKAVIHWDGYTQTMFLSSAVKSDNFSNIAWVVPIISTTKPEVSAGNMSIFEDLVEFFKSNDYWFYYYDHWYKNTAGGRDGNISIIESIEIDIYDIIILRANNASSLIDWLVENNLQVPDETHSVIEKYVNMNNCYFVVNKIDLKNKFKEEIEQIESGNVTLDLTEYYQVLSDLRRGMATPLKFEFTPITPYYPLTISSLNAGDGKIEVYVIAENPVTDKNKVLRVDQCKEIDLEMKEKLAKHISTEKANFVTRLTYNGKLIDLEEDAVFELYPLQVPENPTFIYIFERLEKLSGTKLLNILTWDPEAQTIELQYRIDQKGPWMLAERSDSILPFKIIGVSRRITTPIKEIEGAKWSIELDTEILDDGKHILELRVLRKEADILTHTNEYTQFFSVQNRVDSENTSSMQNQHTDLGPILLPFLIIISMIAVAYISKKTKLHD